MQKKRVLFLCTGNSCRSQMAEGFGKKFLDNQFEFCSAGIEVHGLNQYAVKVMQEIGIDISDHISKTIDDLKVKEFDYVITVCDHANENCPFFPAKTRTMHKSFDDPPKLAKDAKTEEDKLIHYRHVRDEIKEYVIKLKNELI